MKASIKDLATASVWFWRAFKHKDWLWLIVAIVIASMSVTLIKHLGDSVQQSMLAKASNSLGADLVIRSTRPIDDEYQTLAKTYELETRKTVTIVTMALANDQFQLVSLKGVSQRSSLRETSLEFSKSTATIDKPSTLSQSPSTVWIEPKLVQLLKLKPGDRMTLGTQNYAYEPYLKINALINPMSQFAPQAQLLWDAFNQADLLGPGSRATYELELAGEDKNIQAFHRQIEQRLKAAENAKSPLPWTIISAKAPSEDLGKTLDRAWFFLDLSSLSAVLVAGMSILIASRFYLRRWQNSMALLRAFGANNRQMFRLFAGQLFWLSMMSSLIGATLGILLAYLLEPILGNFFDPFIMSSPWSAFFIGAISGVLVLWSFAWQALMEALNTSPIRLLRSVPRNQTVLQWLVSFVFLLLLIALMVGIDWMHWILLGLGILSLSFWGASLLLVKILEFSQGKTSGWKKITISSLLKEKNLLSLQLISIGVVLFVLMLMTFVRQDLLHTWQATLPADAPNTFVMNVQPDQAKDTQHLLQEKSITTDMVAMARGRLVAKNDAPLIPSEQPSKRGQNLLQREANIAIMETLPKQNAIVSSLVNSKTNLPSVSVEEGIAKLFKIQLGDKLSFDFEGKNYDYEVASLRKVEWQSFQLNFFFILEPSQENSLSISYITNFYLAKNPNAQPLSLANELTQSFAEVVPGVLLIDVSAIMQQIQEIMNQAGWAVSGLYLFTLIASVLVLLTATFASQQNRLQSWFLLRSLGATQKTITKVGLSEFILIGALAGILAASLAQMSSWLIGYLWFESTSPISMGLWLTSMASGVGILVFIAWITQARYLKLPALQLKNHL